MKCIQQKLRQNSKLVFLCSVSTFLFVKETIYFYMKIIHNR